ncbi:tRNA ligase [Aspergillus brunneoviolaceus CBS 621.78]|uniref:tRNA ligase n=1 Tax=Aspergillus brunneoviolaceus CBS 621.78 TaxID=1450534 RepID=A0ACD1FT80_9EURO|nr:tRNA ligase [Aspergillus brunneoviolaceus CBS 621.78]RAH40196.1 tRNA ligase [Aspergillus brunneoviolaceus CBS 621.78]
MSYENITPVRQDEQEVAQLVESLEEARKRGKAESKRTFTCKKSTFDVDKTDSIRVNSWKFMDWDYRRHDLPTYARGLFTTQRKDGTHEIAVRGYDKFFNIEEVNATKWRNIEMNTRGPYELSVKENGCIIFISGLEDGTLLVCSKHSTGVRNDAEVSHAQAGERWVERHVKSVGKSVKDLARELRRLNVTAVGELCDDSFEEHVLAYDETVSGIYLHGLNFNVPKFATCSSAEVHAFADSWGFKKANFVLYEDLDQVKKFLEECAETGTWHGRETEGFVIRCQMGEGGRPPYHDWFFKYKFEEPYLMYRQWRECTKAIIAGKYPNIKKHKKITELYLQYARRQLAQNPHLGEQYNKNHGIIAMREGFLQEHGMNGSEIIQMESEDSKEEVVRDVVLVPVASLGCGKTTLGLALVKLFNWGQVQNDNIPKQKNKPKKFAMDINKLLAIHPVVVADRNNHQKREREQLIQDVSAGVPRARFIALHYVHDPKQEMLPGIREVTRQRVLSRGDNHQTIRAGTKNTEEIIGIMEGFLTRFEGVNTDRVPDSDFDEVIDLDVAASSRENLETVVKALHSSYPKLVKEVPTAQQLDDAINWAMNDYQVELDLSQGYSSAKQVQKQKNKSNNKTSTPDNTVAPTAEDLAKKLEYFCISLPAAEITNVLQSLFPPSTDPERARIYHQLARSRRIQPAFHVTLIHRASKRDSPDIWEGYTRHYVEKMKSKPESDPTITPTLAPARVRLERLIWDNRLMVFVARILPPEDGSQGDWPCANETPHITVGTVSQEVKPVESNDLLKRWHEVGSGGETGIWEAEIPGVKVVHGSVGMVMSRGK